MRRLRPVRDPATRFLIAVNAGIFAVQLYVGPSWIRVEDFLGLTESGLRSGAFWQLVTYQFLHANVLHILMNMLGLWFAGRELEPVIGTRRFVILYLVGGVVGGLAQMFFSSGPLIGASASVCAVLLALTSLFPNMPVMALLFFVLPLRMQARTLGLGMVAISVLVWISGRMPEVGHMAHLGGFATGWVFGLIYRRTLGEDGPDYEESVPPSLPGDEPASRRGATSFDEVLAKVMSQGIDSLTRDERRVLEEGRSARRRG
jgi:membrane associated rhomboid family serine protease